MKDLTLIEIIAKLNNNEFSSEQVHNYFLGRIKKYDSKIQAFLTANDYSKSPSHNQELQWVPIAIKDIFSEKDKTTSGASSILSDFKPPYDATLIQKLNKAGMSSLGKVNMDEFAMWSTTENSFQKVSLNPWWNKRIPWWSSWWSAAAVAAWLAPAALWTDTWWSLRQPASLCWVVGFRPSYGRNSRYGVFPMASSFDCPGTITKSVRDAWLLYNIMNGEDQKENTSLSWKDTIDTKIWESNSLNWVKIWVPKEYFDNWLDSWVKETISTAIDKLKELWAEIKDISLPMTKYAIAAYYILVPAEVSTNLARLDGIRYGKNSKESYEGTEELYHNNRWEWLWEESQRRSVVWSYVLSSWFYDAYFMKAAKVRTLIIEDFKKVFEQVDVIVWPAAPSVAWKVWEWAEDPLKMYLADMYTVPSALAWLPGISVPCWFTESSDDEKELLPVGLQILAPRLEEEKLLKIAHTYEQSTDWRIKMVPPGFED